MAKIDFMKRYFVMLYTENYGKDYWLTPMVDPENKMYFFDTVLDCCRAAENTLNGRKFGFLIFDKQNPAVAFL